jgi:glycosyltransferase involved in cell wall biosynthesis
VVANELTALEDTFGPTWVLDGRSNIIPSYANLDIPFLWDYWCLSRLGAQRGETQRLRHAHVYSGCYSESVRFLKSLGVPVTYTSPAHDHELSIEECRLMGVEPPYPHITVPLLYDQHNQGLRLADLVIAPGSAPAEYLDRQGIKNIRVIPHGIAAVPETIAPFPEMFTVGYVGQTGPDKGLVYLIRAWGKLAYKDARLVLAGRGTENMGKLIQQNAPAGNFTLLGYVDDVSKVYNACSICVFPSVTEGFGIGVLEAMAHGRPVIVSDGAGAADVVTPLCGKVVPRRNEVAIMEMITFFKNIDLKVTSFQARKAAGNYTWDKIREQYQRAFRECCR